jgi:ribosomal protein L40E
MWIWIVEIVTLLVFLGFGGSAGFIAWAVLQGLFLAARHFYVQAKLGTAQVALQAERLEGERREATERRLARREREQQDVKGHEERPIAALPESPKRADERRCGSCNALAPADARFCDGCGRPLSADCSKCGAQNRDGARFCKKCGEPIAGSDGKEPPATSTATAPGRPTAEVAALTAKPVTNETQAKPAKLARIIRPVTCRGCQAANRGDAYKCIKCGDVLR